MHNSRPTHYDVANDSTSLLDYFLLSDASCNVVSHQVQCQSISDHALIFGSFNFNTTSHRKYIEYRDYNNIDWNGIFSCLSNFNCDPLLNSTCVDIKCDYFSSLVADLFAYVPIVKKRIWVNCDSWMNSHAISVARSLRDMAYATYRSDRSIENWSMYCRLRNKAKSVIRREKRKYFLQLFGGLDTAGLWRVLRNSGCAGDSNNMTWDGDVDSLNEFFAGGHDSNNNVEYNLDNVHNYNNTFSFRCVDELEVAEALSKVKSGSIGPDCIPIKFLKLIFPHVSILLLDLINYIFLTSRFPVSWKTARVVPIPKSKTVNTPDDLRPISILPALSKVVEHLINSQMLHSVIDNIYQLQYAFRCGFSTT
ncbi:uncharacterized protein LOC119605199 [Lucilia sericata]|uniref:uncharacterized protein LOC119605199 n=1 Tax=Lucilia sericata TaxID=13632 RepID=UPI0018A80ECC|nr:uncharacterized protein LOC119605199 [Lucilia sericata]